MPTRALSALRRVLSPAQGLVLLLTSSAVRAAPPSADEALATCARRVATGTPEAALGAQQLEAVAGPCDTLLPRVAALAGTPDALAGLPWPQRCASTLSKSVAPWLAGLRPAARRDALVSLQQQLPAVADAALVALLAPDQPADVRADVLSSLADTPRSPEFWGAAAREATARGDASPLPLDSVAAGALADGAPEVALTALAALPQDASLDRAILELRVLMALSDAAAPGAFERLKDARRRLDTRKPPKRAPWDATALSAWQAAAAAATGDRATATRTAHTVEHTLDEPAPGPPDAATPALLGLFETYMRLSDLAGADRALARIYNHNYAFTVGLYTAAARRAKARLGGPIAPARLVWAPAVAAMAAPTVSALEAAVRSASSPPDTPYLALLATVALGPAPRDADPTPPRAAMALLAQALRGRPDVARALLTATETTPDEEPTLWTAVIQARRALAFEALGAPAQSAWDAALTAALTAEGAASRVEALQLLAAQLPPEGSPGLEAALQRLPASACDAATAPDR